MSGQPVRGRYAPSPTGALHLGNLRTALLAWLFARAAGGRFVLRIEDLDLPRSRPGAALAILADLRRLGLDWDEGPDVSGIFGPYVQSMRQALYDEAIARLREKGLIYPCYCTRAELAQIASAPQGEEGQPYPGICRRLTTRERAARAASRRRPALRFIAPEEPIQFDDRLHGTVSGSVAATVGDFIVRRSDGIVSYQLAVVVDDALMDITQVIRGADLLASTARQLALYDALEYPRPQEYAHVSLMVDAEGIRLAKRDAAAGLDALRAAGYTPGQVLASLAASCGLHPAETSTTPTDLLAAFDPLRLNRLQTPVNLPNQAHEMS